MSETLEPTTTPDGGGGMHAEPQAEHRWLSRMVGEWTFETEMVMGPDQPPMKGVGRQSNRSLGGLWLIGEGEGGTPDGQGMNSIITLGYDPAKGKFVGSFIASVMTHLWPYEGTLEGNVLTLDSEGPSFSGDGTMAKYQDIVEVVDDDHWILRSRSPGPDGGWMEFMTAHYRRRR
jgi:hypothetical protein